MSAASVPTRLVRRLAAAALALLVTGSVAHATMSLGPLPLRQVTAEAARIVHGRVLAVRADRDEHGLPATWITLQVVTRLKGEAASELTIKQFGVADPLPDGAAPAIIGMPRYAPGEELVLFLYGESTLGFTSPIGMGQGVYRVRDAAASRDGARSTHDGRSTGDEARSTHDEPRAAGDGARAARDTPDDPHEQPADLTQLLDTVRALVAHPDPAP